MKDSVLMEKNAFKNIGFVMVKKIAMMEAMNLKAFAVS